MDFKKWMNENPAVEHIGKVAVFYFPSEKITSKTRKSIHEFLVGNYESYTHEKGGMKGYWLDGKNMTKDHNERYEVSFDGDENFKKLVRFLSELCGKSGEKAIYLTIGGDSYIISPS